MIIKWEPAETAHIFLWAEQCQTNGKNFEATVLQQLQAKFPGRPFDLSKIKNKFDKIYRKAGKPSKSGMGFAKGTTDWMNWTLFSKLYPAEYKALEAARQALPQSQAQSQAQSQSSRITPSLGIWQDDTRDSSSGKSIHRANDEGVYPHIILPSSSTPVHQEKSQQLRQDSSQVNPQEDSQGFYEVLSRPVQKESSQTIQREGLQSVHEATTGFVHDNASSSIHGKALPPSVPGNVSRTVEEPVQTAASTSITGSSKRRIHVSDSEDGSLNLHAQKRARTGTSTFESRVLPTGTAKQGERASSESQQRTLFNSTRPAVTNINPPTAASSTFLHHMAQSSVSNLVDLCKEQQARIESLEANMAEAQMQIFRLERKNQGYEHELKLFRKSTDFASQLSDPAKAAKEYYRQAMAKDEQQNEHSRVCPLLNRTYNPSMTRTDIQQEFESLQDAQSKAFKSRRTSQNSQNQLSIGVLHAMSDFLFRTGLATDRNSRSQVMQLIDIAKPAHILCVIMSQVLKKEIFETPFPSPGQTRSNESMMHFQSLFSNKYGFASVFHADSFYHEHILKSQDFRDRVIPSKAQGVEASFIKLIDGIFSTSAMLQSCEIDFEHCQALYKKCLSFKGELNLNRWQCELRLFPIDTPFDATCMMAQNVEGDHLEDLQSEALRNGKVSLCLFPALYYYSPDSSLQEAMLSTKEGDRPDGLPLEKALVLLQSFPSSISQEEKKNGILIAKAMVLLQ
ncbi:hypothetical protein BT63DRAFT_484300 [Microthyrium microscopicum]|uniref:Myb/SANT-like domain-containing protein n=1 Tax=Microthyrium microscopicum TaxID=703497 RepID=A0A6A6TU36_9PEZI|nr:hypothetical protein BT63DRAFT_484300 [Microthyrium microscopicum]